MDTRWLTERLPPIEYIPRRSEADFYGASYLISNPLGLPAPPRSCASWKHGVTYADKWKQPELMLTEGNRLTRHLVSIDTQASQLRKRGYLRVRAVGAPIIYVEPSPVPRIPGSLLIMPPHSLSKTTHTFNERQYIESIASIQSRFDVVVACIGAHSVRKGEWVHTLESCGIPWVLGADSTDRNALRRMVKLFDSFEYMTSNTLGSHIAYAAYRDCKVSLWGPFAQYRLEDFRGVPWYQRNWDAAEDVIESVSEQSVRCRHPELFKSPWEAVSLQEWAAQYLGVAHKREPAELARLLGWTAIGQAEVFIHRAAKGCTRLGRTVARRMGHLSTT